MFIVHKLPALVYMTLKFQFVLRFGLKAKHFATAKQCQIEIVTGGGKSISVFLIKFVDRYGVDSVFINTAVCFEVTKTTGNTCQNWVTTCYLGI